MNRAYSLLEVKNFEEDRRILTGVATTPTPDRVGDIVEPFGVKFANPLPLLHQHRSDQPVGHVTFKKPTKDGITFEARLPHIKEAGPLKDRVDTAWAEVKAGLVRGVSIGFRGIESELMDTGGIRFKETEVMELSLVTVPANAEATIHNIKSFDTAASGDNEPSPASREKTVKIKPKTMEKKMSQTTAEKISAFEASRSAKAARMEAIMEEAGDETLDESQSEEYDTIKTEIKKVDEHLARLNDLARAQVSKAVVAKGGDAREGTASRTESVRVSVKQPQLEKGIALARYAKCLALSSKLFRDPAVIAQEIYPNHEDLHQVFKTAVAAGTTGVVGYAGALVGNETTIFADFAEYLRPLTILGRFGSGDVPSLRRVPFRTRLLSQTAGGTAYWVGEGQPKPVTNFTFASTTLLPYKVAALTALSMEVIRDSSPSAEAIVRDQLAQAVAARMDTDFLDPQKGANVSNQVDAASPASISNNLTAIASVGRDADSVRTDLVNVFAQYISTNNTPINGVWVMSAVTALQLSLMTNALGQPEFPGLGMLGGRLQGLPVITSEYLGYTFDSPVSGRDVFLVNAGDIYYGDDGGMEVKMSTETSLQMDDAPTNASGPTVAATSLVSMFQTNSVAFLAEKTVSWKRRRTEGCVWLAGVEWGENADSATVP
jgi:HK97 family phage major capsid protein/HK97 family phage prohead protease